MKNQTSISKTGSFITIAFMIVLLVLILSNVNSAFGQSTTLAGSNNQNIAVLYVSDPSNPSPDIIVYQNYPNPFTMSTVIKFETTTSLQVKLAIYDQNSNLVKAYIYDNLQPGLHEVSLDGNGLTPGEYTYRFTSGTYSQEYKMNLVR